MLTLAIPITGRMRPGMRVCAFDTGGSSRELHKQLDKGGTIKATIKTVSAPKGVTTPRVVVEFDP